MADENVGTGSLADATPNPYAEMSNEEYAAAHVAGGEDPTKPKSPQPVQTFWDKLLHGVNGTSRTKEMLRSTVRGALDAGTEAVRTIGEGAAYVDRKTGLGEKIQPGFNEEYDTAGAHAMVKDATSGADEVMDHYLGKRSDDPLAAFTESTAQFMSGWAATGMLKGMSALKGSKEVLAGLARGAVIDASMFDPYEAQLAELAAKAPVPVAKQLGALLSVKGDDGAIVARLKRAAAGLVPAATIEGLIAASRVVRVGKQMAKGATPEAVDALAEHAKTVDAVAANEHVPEGAQVHADPATLTIANADGTPIEHAPSPVFADHVEAAQQAESVNAALTARATAGQVDEGQVRTASENLSAFLTDRKPEALAAVADVPIDISHHTTPDDALKIAQTLSDKFSEQVRHAVESQGEVHVEQSMQMALNGLGEVPQNLAHGVMSNLLQRMEGQSVTKLAADYVMKSYQDNISRLTEAVHARPHDPVAVDELRTGIQNYFDLQEKFLAANSDAARGLRLGQERPKLSGADVKFAGDSPVSNAPPAAPKPPKVKAAVEETKNVGETIRGAMKDAEDAIAGIRKNTTDTNAVTAADFSLAKARKVVEAARKKIETGDIEFEHSPDLALTHAEDIKTAADAQRSNPATLSPEEAAQAKTTKTSTRNPIEELSSLLDAQERRLDAELERAKQPPRPKRPTQTTPVDDLKAEVRQQEKDEPHKLKDAKPDAPLGIEKTADDTIDLQSKVDEVLNALDGAKTKNGKDVAKSAGKDLNKLGPVYGPLNLNGMSVEQVKALGRIFKMSGGEPRNAEAIAKAATVIQDGKPIKQALELFTNFLLSGPATSQTIAASGAVLNSFEPIVRMAAGVGSGNGALIREGADMLAGAFRFFKENAITAGVALRDGKGVIDPSPQTIAIGGMTGKVIRVPGSAAGAAHEFSKVTGYRSWVYAKSLREGRASGLTGDALGSYVENNLRAAFGKDGIAVVPDALKYGQLTSMATPLTDGSFSQALQKLNQNAAVARFIQPFVKVSANIFKYTWMSSPGLNMLNKEWRATMLAGGEEAAIMHARSVAATGIAGFAYTHALAGNLTGRGPSDPALRSMWLKDHQPYSFRTDGDSPWHSYSRFEPLSMTLGLVADYNTIHNELGEQHSDTEQAFYATIAAITSNLASKRYMQGISEFGQVWGSDNPQKVGTYLQNLAANIAVPAVVSRFNADPVYREARTLHDAILNRLPGFSETLDPRYSWAGEPILKTPGIWNRMSLSTTKESTQSPVEEEALKLEQGLVPFPSKLYGTNIDLSDRTRFDNGTGVSPYRRFMELLNAPKDGDQNLRDRVTELVKSPEWQDMSPGAPGFPGGMRMLQVQKIKTQAEGRALRAVREEYPKLDDMIKAQDRMKNAAITGGESGVQDIEAEFGVKRALKK